VGRWLIFRINPVASHVLVNPFLCQSGVPLLLQLLSSGQHPHLDDAELIWATRIILRLFRDEIPSRGQMHQQVLEFAMRVDANKGIIVGFESKAKLEALREPSQDDRYMRIMGDEMGLGRARVDGDVDVFSQSPTIKHDRNEHCRRDQPPVPANNDGPGQ
jgi:hypothetical protein